jgi:hypothetical protein
MTQIEENELDKIRLFTAVDVAEDIKDALIMGNNFAIKDSYATIEDKDISENELHLFCYDDCWFRVIIEEMEKQP